MQRRERVSLVLLLMTLFFIDYVLMPQLPRPGCTVLYCEVVYCGNECSCSVYSGKGYTVMGYVIFWGWVGEGDYLIACCVLVCQM